MNAEYPDSDLEAYLDEELPAELMTRIEDSLRQDKELSRRLAAINSRRDAGVHSLGEIWRRNRLSCPTRQTLGSYLLGALLDEESSYVRFHVEVIGCRCCQANLADLRSEQAEASDAVETRRRKYFESSAGYLHRGGRGRKK